MLLTERFFHALGRFLARHARPVLLLALLVTVGAGWLAATRLRVVTGRNDVLGGDLDFNRRFVEFSRDFGDQEHLLVIVESADPKAPVAPAPERIRIRARMKAFLSACAADLRTRPGLFPEVVERVDPASLGDAVLLFAPTADLRALDEGLRTWLPKARPVLERMDPSAALEIAAESLRDPVAPRSEAERDAAALQLLAFERFLGALADALEGKETPVDRLDPAPLLGSSGDRDPDGFFFTPDGRYAYLLARPAKDDTSLNQVSAPLDYVREILEARRPAFPDLRAAVTGLPAIYSDEMASANRDMTRSTIGAFLAVALLLAAAFRQVLRPLLAAVVLGVGIVWTFGFATLAVGRLNILSLVFPVNLVGLGVDFGIYTLTQHLKSGREGGSAAEILARTLKRIGVPLTVGAATTALAFYTALFTDFEGLAELGLIAGTGILLCWLAMIAVYAALLYGLDARRAPAAGGHLTAVSVPSAPEPLRAGWRRTAAPMLVGAAVIAAWAATDVTFDHNLLKLQPRGVESVVWEHKLMASENRALFAVSVTKDPERLRTLSAAYAREAADVRTTDALIPAGEAEKRAILAGIRGTLEGLTFPQKRPPPTDPAALRRVAASIRQSVRRLRGMDAQADAALGPLQGSLDRILLALRPAGDPVPGEVPNAKEAIAERLEWFQFLLMAKAREAVSFLHRASEPKSLTPDDLTGFLRRRYVGASGALALYAYPSRDIWEWKNLESFVAAVRRADPEATGAPIQIYETGRILIRSFRRTALFAALTILAMVWLNMRSLRTSLIALSPLVASLLLLTGGMVATGLTFNFANFFAIPILIGTGVAYGVHITYALEHGERGDALRQTYRAVLLSSATTIIGFGSLIPAAHRGLSSLGTILAIGNALCLLTSLILVPSWYAWAEFRRQAAGAGGGTAGSRQ